MNYYFNKSKKKKIRLGKGTKGDWGQSICKYQATCRTEKPASDPEFSSHEMSWEEQGGLGLGVIQAATSHLT